MATRKSKDTKAPKPIAVAKAVKPAKNEEAPYYHASVHINLVHSANGAWSPLAVVLTTKTVREIVTTAVALAKERGVKIDLDVGTGKAGPVVGLPCLGYSTFADTLLIALRHAIQPVARVPPGEFAVFDPSKVGYPHDAVNAAFRGATPFLGTRDNPFTIGVIAKSELVDSAHIVDRSFHDAVSYHAHNASAFHDKVQRNPSTTGEVLRQDFTSSDSRPGLHFGSTATGSRYKVGHLDLNVPLAFQTFDDWKAGTAVLTGNCDTLRALFRKESDLTAERITSYTQSVDFRGLFTYLTGQNLTTSSLVSLLSNEGYLTKVVRAFAPPSTRVPVGPTRDESPCGPFGPRFHDQMELMADLLVERLASRLISASRSAPSAEVPSTDGLSRDQFDAVSNIRAGRGTGLLDWTNHTDRDTFAGVATSILKMRILAPSVAKVKADAF